MNSKQKGDLTELQVLTYLCSLGYKCSIPFGEDCDYDLIADINHKLIRIQVKTSSQKFKNNPNIFEFSCKRTGKNHRYASQEIDYFGTYWNDKCYLIPINECSIAKTLHLVKPKSGQIKRINFASKYEAEKQLELLQKY